MTAILVHADQTREIDALLAAGKLNRLANDPRIAQRICPGARVVDLTPIALAPATVLVFYDYTDAGLFYPWRPDRRYWEGHYLFTTLRGKGAREVAQWMCRAVFDWTPAAGIVGEVPAEHRAARVMSRAIGCRLVGSSVDMYGRPSVLYLMERGHG